MLAGPWGADPGSTQHTCNQNIADKCVKLIQTPSPNALPEGVRGDPFKRPSPEAGAGRTGLALPLWRSDRPRCILRHMTHVEYQSPVVARPRVSLFVWVGLVVIAVGCGPLLGIILAAKLGWTADPNPNPILFGVLAMLTFWPGLILAVVGTVLTVVRRARARSISRVGP